MTGPGANRAIRVLVAEDSPVTREYLVHLLGQDGTLEVVGAARDGLDALEQAERLRPDVIVMDLHMPRMNGCDATRRIMEQVPTPVVMTSASLAPDEVRTTFEALSAGALTMVRKPAGFDHPDHLRTARQLLDAVRLMSEVKVVRRWLLRPPREPRPVPTLGSGRHIRAIAIGASTGGPAVIARILGELQSGFPVPILLVQHMPEGFSRGLADWLGQGTRLAVKLAEPDERLRPGAVFVAPDGLQMGVSEKGRIRLTNGSGEEGFCPSASFLFRSLAGSFGSSGAGILLTGMGRDGAEGLRKLREAGGVTIVQDEDTSVVFGMPGEAIRIGAAEHALSPEQILAVLRAVAAPREK